MKIFHESLTQSHMTGEVYKISGKYHMFIRSFNSYAMLDLQQGKVASRWFDSVEEADEAFPLDTQIASFLKVYSGGTTIKNHIVGNTYEADNGYYQVIQDGNQYAELNLEYGIVATLWFDSLEKLDKAYPGDVLKKVKLWVEQ